MSVPLQDTLILRDIARSDAAACAVLSRAVDWPHRVEDWEMGIALGRGVVATLGTLVVATALWWPYGDDHATLGMIIVSPDHQGSGIGKRLMQALFTRTRGRSLMLNATVAGEPLYLKSGFVACGGVIQHQGEVLASAAPVLAAGESLRQADPADLPLMERLDAQATGLARQPLLAELMVCGEGVLLVRGDATVGFSVRRRFGRGLVVGPVVAATDTDAMLLISHWLHRSAGCFVRIDIPNGSGLSDWLAMQGLKPVNTVTAMVRGTAPGPSGPARLHALTNQALG